MGGLPLLPQNGKSEGVGGSYMKFPPWWGYGYFLETHNDINVGKNDIINYLSLSLLVVEILGKKGRRK